MASLSEITDGRLTEFKRVMANAGLDTELVEAVNKKPEVATSWVEQLRDLLGIIVSPYADEQVDVAYGYPDGYQSKSPGSQLNVLKKLYPELKSTAGILAWAKRLGDLQGKEELLQVAPKLSAIARIHSIDDPYGSGYGKCLEVMLSHISSSRKFHNYREGRLTEKHVRLLQSTREVLEKLEAETQGDYLVIPMQSGHLYGGYSPRNARWEIENNGQWALPAWVVGHHLLTHTERCVKWEELEPDCPGDEYSPDADGSFEHSLYFDFSDGKLKFDYRWADYASDYYGSVSGFRRE